MITLTVLRSEWKANLADLNKPDGSFPYFTTISPKPTYTRVSGIQTKHQSPPSPEEITALRCFATALLGFEGEVTESNGWQLLKTPWRMSGNFRSVLAQIRGERSVGPFDFWGEGKIVERFTNSDLDIDIDYVLDDQASGILKGSGYCTWRAESSLHNILDRLPRSHSHHRSLNMKPHAASPISEATQAGLIAKLPFIAPDLRGWVMTGPPGTSKTTYAAAALVDMYTYVKCRDHELWLYRVEVPDWLAETAAWDNRDFDEDRPQQPKISAGDIKRQGGHPVLWLEELDKFNPTETRLNYLYRLVNAVYEMEGLIIVTCNDTKAELREKLGPAISRRIFGDNDDSKCFLNWSLFTAASKGSKQQGKAK